MVGGRKRVVSVLAVARETPARAVREWRTPSVVGTAPEPAGEAWGLDEAEDEAGRAVLEPDTRP